MGHPKHPKTLEHLFLFILCPVKALVFKTPRSQFEMQVSCCKRMVSCFKCLEIASFSQKQFAKPLSCKCVLYHTNVASKLLLD